MEILSHSGYKIQGRKGINHWHPLFEEWLLCVERYCRVAAGEDAPFIYNERANIGLLAGAAWRSGRTALEEFQYRKGHKNRKKWNGRADLYISCDEREEIIEAKFGWLSLVNPDSASDRIEEVMRLAVKDALVTQGGAKDLTSLAVAFLPAWQKAGDPRQLEDHIAETLKQSKFANVHGIGWCFPKHYRSVVSEKGNLTPGIIMAVSNTAYVD